MIQGRVFVDDSPTGQFTGEAGVSQPQCADDVSLHSWLIHINSHAYIWFDTSYRRLLLMLITMRKLQLV